MTAQNSCLPIELQHDLCDLQRMKGSTVLAIELVSIIFWHLFIGLKTADVIIAALFSIIELTARNAMSQSL